MESDKVHYVSQGRERPKRIHTPPGPFGGDEVAVKLIRLVEPELPAAEVRIRASSGSVAGITSPAIIRNTVQPSLIGNHTLETR
jgi:hypothetical protein